jgi:hypothetical protein
MRARISTPELLDELIEFLDLETDTSVHPISGDEVEISLLGSYSSNALRMELYLRLRAWEASCSAAGSRVEIVG